MLTSYKMLQARHGPGCQNEDMKCGPSTELLLKWPSNLKHCFGTVVMDEAYTVCNPSSRTSMAIQWLAAPFRLLLTAMPLYNSKLDFHGLLQFTFLLLNLYHSSAYAMQVCVILDA